MDPWSEIDDDDGGDDNDDDDIAYKSCSHLITIRSQPSHQYTPVGFLLCLCPVHIDVVFYGLF
jgi:hypothetical protein